VIIFLELFSGQEIKKNIGEFFFLSLQKFKKICQDCLEKLKKLGKVNPPLKPRVQGLLLW
jgi:hypothetical protein